MALAESLKYEEKNVNRAAGVVSFYTFISRILGLVRDVVIAAFFGTGMVADAFVVAMRIPNLLRRLFAEGSLTIAFVPVFTEYLTHKTKEEAFDMARAVLTILSIVLVVVTLLGIVFAPWIVKIQAWGFGGAGAKHELTVLLTRITFPYIFFISIVAFFMGVLNSLKHFAAPAAAPIFLNVGIIGAAYFLSPYCSEQVVGVAWGVFIGGVLQVWLQIPWIFKEGLNLVPRWQPGHPAIKRIGMLMLPAVFGSAIYQLNSFVGTLLASFLPQGSMSSLYFADRLIQFPLGVFAIAIGTAVLPSLSIIASKRDTTVFGDTFDHALRLVFFITLPATVGLIVLGKPLIQVMFERGDFDALSTQMTLLALFYYALGLWAFSGIRILVSAFYALQDTKTPVKVASVAFVVNSLTALALMGPLQQGGIALALSISSSVQFCLLFYFLGRKTPLPKMKGILISVLKNIIASVIMGAVIQYLNARWLIIEADAGILIQWASIMGLVCTGMIVYLVCARILGCTELASAVQMFVPGNNKKGAGRKAQGSGNTTG